MSQAPAPEGNRLHTPLRCLRPGAREAVKHGNGPLMTHAETRCPHRQRAGRISKQPRDRDGWYGDGERHERVKRIVQRPLVEVGEGCRDRLKAVASLHANRGHHQRPARDDAHREDRQHHRPKEHQRPDRAGKGNPPFRPHRQSEERSRNAQREDSDNHEQHGVERRQPRPRAVERRPERAGRLLADELERHVPRDPGAEDRPDQHEPCQPGHGTEQLVRGRGRAERDAHEGDELGERLRQPAEEVVGPRQHLPAGREGGRHHAIAGREDHAAVERRHHAGESVGAGQTELAAGRPAGPGGHRPESSQQNHGG